MKKLIPFLFLALTVFSANANAKTKVFACEPEWQSLAKEIGGENIDTFSATTFEQDPHYIRAKPSLIAQIRNADLLVCSGADLEIGWLPVLLENAPAKIQNGKDGNLMIANFINTIEKPALIDRSMGDIHPQGNPHLHLDPRNILIAAKLINERLQKIDSGSAQIYQKNYDEFVGKWQKSMKVWQSKATPLKGKKVIVHHRSFSYLLNYLGMIEAGSLEPKPGVPPTISHLEELLVMTKKEPIKFIIRTPYEDDQASNWLSDKSKIKTLVLPYTIGGKKEVVDLSSLFDQTINLLLEDN